VPESNSPTVTIWSFGMPARLAFKDARRSRTYGACNFPALNRQDDLARRAVVFVEADPAVNALIRAVLTLSWTGTDRPDRPHGTDRIRGREIGRRLIRLRLTHEAVRLGDLIARAVPEAMPD
jgi:hypothetical protein